MTLRTGFICTAAVVLGACADCRCGRAAPTSATSEKHVPYELSDARALVDMSSWQSIPHLGTGRYRMQSSAARPGAPASMDSRPSENDFNHFICRGHETVAPATSAFVVDQRSCDELYVRGMVMARFEGSGTLARFWMTSTSIRAGRPESEVVRIYVDDGETPAMTVPLADMLGPDARDLFAPPFGSGSPHAVAWYYPVVFGKKLIATLDGLADGEAYFHQTSVVLDTPAAPRQAATERLDNRDGAISFLRTMLPAGGTTRTLPFELDPGAEQSLEVDGPATIIETRVRLAKDALPELASLRLRVAWDDSHDDAIVLPLTDLFAATDRAPEPSGGVVESQANGDDLELRFALPMPFASRAVWKLRNDGTKRVDGALLLTTVGTLPPSPWGKLHTETHETLAPAHDGMHPLAVAAGRGKLAGVCIQMHGHGTEDGPTMEFLEGNETGIADGESVLRGTGTEDYFNGAFFFEDGARSSPFAQVWAITPHSADNPVHGSVSACRWHIFGDAINFASSLDLHLEIGPGNPALLDAYRSVAYVYR